MRPNWWKGGKILARHLFPTAQKILRTCSLINMAYLHLYVKITLNLYYLTFENFFILTPPP